MEFNTLATTSVIIKVYFSIEGLFLPFSQGFLIVTFSLKFAHQWFGQIKSSRTFHIFLRGQRLRLSNHHDSKGHQKDKDL